MASKAPSKVQAKVCNELKTLAHGQGINDKKLALSVNILATRAVVAHTTRLGLVEEQTSIAAQKVIVCYAGWAEKLGKDPAELLCNALNIARSHSTLATRRSNYMRDKHMGRKGYASRENEAYHDLAGLLMSENGFHCKDKPTSDPQTDAAALQWKARLRKARSLVDLAFLELREVTDDETAMQALRRLAGAMPRLASLTFDEKDFNLYRATAVMIRTVDRYYATGLQAVRQARPDIPILETSSALRLFTAQLMEPDTYPALACTPPVTALIDAVAVGSATLSPQDLKGTTTARMRRIHPGLPTTGSEILGYAVVQSFALISHILSAVEVLDLWELVVRNVELTTEDIPWLSDDLQWTEVLA